MENNVLEDPMLHWVKVLILIDASLRLRKSSRTAAHGIHRAVQQVLSGEMTEETKNDTVEILEKVLHTNLNSIEKVATLLETAIVNVPENMQQWPSQN